jgi:1,4-dihydroxy-2-naphthoate octaprenyltransferase
MTIKFLKIHKWWTSHFGTMLAFIYLATAFGSDPPSLIAFATTLALFVIASIGIASFGQLMNDLMDIQQDLRSGSPNTMARRGIAERLLLFGFVIVLGLLPWLWLPINGAIASLLVLEYVLFILYSVPPVRLKARGLLGAAADSLYAYVVTNAVSILVFAKLSGSDVLWFSLLSGVWMFIFGLGHIIQHQLLDASRDHVDGINTLVVSWGWVASLALLRNVILPLDYLGFSSILVIIGTRFPVIPFVFAVHLLLLAHWWQRQAPCGSLDWNKFPFVDQINLLSNQGMSQFVWHWLPLLSLLSLIASHPSYLPMLVPHCLLFPRPIQLLLQNGRPTVNRFLKQI